MVIFMWFLKHRWAHFSGQFSLEPPEQNTSLQRILEPVTLKMEAIYPTETSELLTITRFRNQNRHVDLKNKLPRSAHSCVKLQQTQRACHWVITGGLDCTSCYMKWDFEEKNVHLCLRSEIIRNGSLRVKKRL